MIPETLSFGTSFRCNTSFPTRLPRGNKINLPSYVSQVVGVPSMYVRVYISHVCNTYTRVHTENVNRTVYLRSIVGNKAIVSSTKMIPNREATKWLRTRNGEINTEASLKYLVSFSYSACDREINDIKIVLNHCWKK